MSEKKLSRELVMRTLHPNLKDWKTSDETTAEITDTYFENRNGEKIWYLVKSIKSNKQVTLIKVHRGELYIELNTKDEEGSEQFHKFVKIIGLLEEGL